MSSRLQARLANCVADGRYYEAQQLYKTLAFRLCAGGKFEEAVDLLFEGSDTLLSRGMMEGGGDLACQLVQVQEQSSQRPDDAFVQRVAALCGQMKIGVTERETLVTNATELLRKRKAGEQLLQLHTELGYVAWQQAQHALALHHFVRSDCHGYRIAQLLVEFSELGYKSELELFLTLGVLQLLCAHKPEQAVACFYGYTREHPELVGRGPPFAARPLVNFCWLLLRCVSSGQRQPTKAFHFLCESYRACLERDPNYGGYLAKIGQLYFNIQPARDPATSLFANILRAFNCDEQPDESAAASESAGPAASQLTTDEID